jgi:hypothetical protein
MQGLAQRTICLQLLWQRHALGSKFRALAKFYRVLPCNGSAKITFLSKICITYIVIIQPRERRRVCQRASPKQGRGVESTEWGMTGNNDGLGRAL